MNAKARHKVAVAHPLVELKIFLFSSQSMMDLRLVCGKEALRLKAVDVAMGSTRDQEKTVPVVQGLGALFETRVRVQRRTVLVIG